MSVGAGRVGNRKKFWKSGWGGSGTEKKFGNRGGAGREPEKNSKIGVGRGGVGDTISGKDWGKFAHQW